MTPAPATSAASGAGGRHRAVMCDEVVAALAPAAGDIFADATFGGGGYTRALLDAAPCCVWALDRDAEAIERGRALEAAYAGRLELVHGRF